MNEIWKDVIGYEGLYKVSNLGKVKSLPKVWNTSNGGTRWHNGKILSPYILNGYNSVGLCKNGKSRTFLVHQLVAQSFLKHTPCRHKLVIDHINDNKLDNRVQNLQIVTARFNVHKTQGKGLSKFKGVSKYKSTGKYRAMIFINGKNKYLGLFINEYDAHLAYENALKQLQK